MQLEIDRGVTRGGGVVTSPKFHPNMAVWTGVGSWHCPGAALLLQKGTSMPEHPDRRPHRSRGIRTNHHRERRRRTNKAKEKAEGTLLPQTTHQPHPRPLSSGKKMLSPRMTSRMPLERSSAKKERVAGVAPAIATSRRTIESSCTVAILALRPKHSRIILPMKYRRSTSAAPARKNQHSTSTTLARYQYRTSIAALRPYSTFTMPQQYRNKTTRVPAPQGCQ